MAIHFFEENIQFDLPNRTKIKNWLKLIAINEGFKIKELNYIFCSDEYLYEMNRKYLQHDTYTDIITFDNSEKKLNIEGDIYISIERVKDNALSHMEVFEKELLRVLSHGIFHLCGYKDKSSTERKLMRLKENEAVDLYYKKPTVPRGTV